MASFSRQMLSLENETPIGYQMEDGRKAPLLGWSAEYVGDVQYFRRVWLTMAARNRDCLMGIEGAFVMWMIESLPDVHRHFHDYQTEASGGKVKSTNEAGFLKHSIKIVEQLDNLIQLLGSPDFADAVAIVAQQHVTKKIKASDFEMFRDRFHLLVFDLTSTGRKGRAGKLWYEFLDMIVNVYKREEKAYSLKSRTERFKHMCCCCQSRCTN